MNAILEYLKGYDYDSDKRRANIINSEKTLLNDFLGGDRIRYDPLKEFGEGGASDAKANDFLDLTDSNSGREVSAILDSSKASLGPALSMERSKAEGFDGAIECPTRQQSNAIGTVDSPSTPVSATRLLPNARQIEIQNQSPPSAFPHSYPTTGITREPISTIFDGPSSLNFSPSFGAAGDQNQDIQPSLALNQLARWSASLNFDATESVPFGGHPDLTSTAIEVHLSKEQSYDPHSHPMFNEALRGHRRNQSSPDSLLNADLSTLPSEYLHGGETSNSPQVQNVQYKHQSSNHPVYEPQQHETPKFDRQSFHHSDLLGISQKYGTSSQNQQSSHYNNPLNNLYQHTTSSIDDQLSQGRMEKEGMQGHGTRDLRFGSLHEARMDDIHTVNVHNPVVDKTFPRTNEDDYHCVAKLMVSMYEMSLAQDNETMLKTWRGSMSDRARVEEAAWDILACCKSRHQRNGPFSLSKKPLCEYHTFEQRLSSICQAMLYQKTVCQSLVKQSFREEVIENPRSAVSRIRNNRKVNLVKKHAIEVGREALGERTAGKGHKVTSVSGSEMDGETDEQYDMEEQSLINPSPPAIAPVQWFKRRIAESEDGESAHYQGGSMPKKAKRSKYQLNGRKRTVNNRSHTKRKAATNLGVRRRAHDVAFVHNIAAAKTDSQARSNGVWHNEPQARGSKRRRAADDEVEYQNGEYNRHGSKKAKTGKSA